jgi:prepilin-type N-terminal cleavage/methylation domain-containing protein
MFSRDSGFTLTELAVAMLVLGIVAALAVPSYLGYRNDAFDKEAQASVSAAMTAAQTFYAETGDFNGTHTGNIYAACNHVYAYLDVFLQKIQPDIDFISPNVSSTGPKVVSVGGFITYNSNGESLGCQAFYATALSRSGTCWVGRITVEGKWLSEYGVIAGYSPILVQGNTNTENAQQPLVTDNPINGNAYAAFKPQSSAADQDAIANETLAVANYYCHARHCIIDGTFMPGYISYKEFYDSWRNVAGALPTG